MAFQNRLFFRIVSRNKESYFLKIITLAISFACSALILVFCIHEFGYDKFHSEYHSIFRVIQRNNSEDFIGNRFSNKIKHEVYNALKSVEADSLITSRVKLLRKVNVLSGDHVFENASFYAADSEITTIFSFEIVNGSLQEFDEVNRAVILSESEAFKYFDTAEAAGKELRLFTFGDTLLFNVVAVYKDYPQNTHEGFNSFVKFECSSIQALNFNPKDAGIYIKITRGSATYFERFINGIDQTDEFSYKVQTISDIYFGPRIAGEDAKHGDRYSIIILICITFLILFLSLTSFINLTTLTLPYRSKELAIKKLAGTIQSGLIISFLKESILVVGTSLIIGVLMLIFLSGWIMSTLSIDIFSLFLKRDFQLIIILGLLFLVVVTAPLFMILRFTGASPNRLLRTETITFPRFKRIIIFLQLGISIFLIVTAMVIRRQINYSLLKEPGRNYDQIVYVSYPNDLTNEGLSSMRAAWKSINPNIVDLMATSRLPDRVNSRELDSEFYHLYVDRGFNDFFKLEFIEGGWFNANEGDSVVVVNERANVILGDNNASVVGVFKDLSGEFNQPEKPMKVKVSSSVKYNYLCIRILEVDIRRTVQFLEKYFQEGSGKASVSFLDKHFEEWLRYQDRLNSLSEILAIISLLLSCFAVYGLSMGIVRDKIKQIAIHKLFGASVFKIIRILVNEFVLQMLIAILIFGPLTYIVITEILRNFVYTTKFNWLDPLFPIAYCLAIIILLCGFQTLSLSREDLSEGLKG